MNLVLNIRTETTDRKVLYIPKTLCGSLCQLFFISIFSFFVFYKQDILVVG